MEYTQKKAAIERKKSIQYRPVDFFVVSIDKSFCEDSAVSKKSCIFF